MLTSDNILYEDKHYIIINNTQNNTFYYIDYDKRDASINMEFQHLHRFYEIMILLSPSASHLIEGVPYTIHSGDMVLLAPSILHKSIYYKGEPSRRIIIDFMFPLNMPASQKAYETILQPFHAQLPIYRFDYEHQQKLVEILNSIYRFSDSHQYYGNEADEFYIHARFQEFLYLLYEMQDCNTYVNDQTYNSIEQRIYEITAYIHSHYEDPVSLNSLSDMFYISPSYLSREFKRVTHFNLTSYIQMTRIRNAQYRLSATDSKITEIASDCGFTSFSQFNRIFNRVTGKSPREYRNASHH